MRTTRILAATAGALFLLVGCSTAATEPTSTPEATRPAQTSQPGPTATETEPPSASGFDPNQGITFAQGQELAPDTYIEWSDGLIIDEGWRVHEPDSGQGTWSYATADGVCVASFVQTRYDHVADGDQDATETFLSIFSGIDIDLIREHGEPAEMHLALFRDRVVEAGMIVVGYENGSSMAVVARAFEAIKVGLGVAARCDDMNSYALLEEILNKNWVFITSSY